MLCLIPYHSIHRAGFSNLRFIVDHLPRHFSRKVEKSSKWRSVIGLEVHVQIKANSKLFSGAEFKYLAPPNSKVSLFDAAIPGTLPILNKRCVEAGVLTALSLSSNINPVSLFDRKHYFYADLPAGYQITQQRLPLAQGGHLEFEVFTAGIHSQPYTKTCNLIQLQLEQDSGRSLHEEKKSRTLIDLNRAGVPLMELVFAPDLTDGEEAVAMVRELIRVLECLDVCSCKMEEGALRVDANISVCPKNSSELGVRSEVKNIASARGVANAIHFEVKRQIEILEKGGTVVNETRFWDASSNETYSMRDKEVDQDYRFMPEPNLLPLRVDLTGSLSDPNIVNVPSLKTKIPELPWQLRHRLKEDYQLSNTVVSALMANSKLLDLFLDVLSSDSSRSPKIASKVIVIELLGVLNKNNMKLEHCPLMSSSIGEVIDLLQNGTINLLIVKKLITELSVNQNPQKPLQIVLKNGWQQITDPDEIKKICEVEISRNPKLVKLYKTGSKEKHLVKLMKNVAESSGGKVNMQSAVVIMKELLEKER